MMGKTWRANKLFDTNDAYLERSRKKASGLRKQRKTGRRHRRFQGQVKVEGKAW